VERHDALTFKELQDATLAAGFAEAQRIDAKRWINFRYAWLWDIADWSFKNATDLVTVTAGSQTVTGVAADMLQVLGLFNSAGTPLVAIPDYTAFAEAYIGTTASAATLPEAYTILGSTIMVGPTAGTTDSNYLLVYKKGATELVGDNDVPAIPPLYHLALVHGAKAEGFKLNAVPSLADSFDADFQAAITAMKATYLSNLEVPLQVPAYLP
jgi:hypothetical protein